MQTLIDEALKGANEWLLHAQNADGGWGNHQGDSSTILNTAEATLALLLLGEQTKNIAVQHGLKFLQKAIREECGVVPHLARDYAWAGVCLLKAYEAEINEISIVAKWLVEHQSKLGYWDEEDCYSTSISLRFLSMIPTKNSETIQKAVQWLLNHFDSIGWGSQPGRETSVGITAQVVLSLIEAGLHVPHKDAICIYLLQSVRDLRSEIIHSVAVREWKSVFHHFSLAWGIMALLKLGISSETIMDAVQALILLQDVKTGGWSPIEGGQPRTWATFGAVAALKAYKSKATPVQLSPTALRARRPVEGAWVVVDQLRNRISGPFESFTQAQESLSKFRRKGLSRLAISSYWRTVELEE